MEYLSLRTGNLLTILFPLNFIIIKVMAYTRLFHTQRIEKISKIIFLLIGVITTPIFYLTGYNAYYCFTIHKTILYYWGRK